MPNFKEHLKLGAVVGLGIKIFITGLQQKEQGFFDLRKLLHEGLKGAVLGAIGAIIPDILEPASQPHHRGIFHSFFVCQSLLMQDLKLRIQN